MTNEVNEHYNSGPAYKQPWFWMIMAPLITTIIVGTSMLVYSIIVYQGTTVNQFSKDRFDLMPLFEREQKAQSLNIKAMTWLDGDKLTVNLSGAFDEKPQTLQLTIYSPVSKQQDVKIELTLEEGVYSSFVDLNQLSKRTMQITDPTDNSWLIQTKQSWPITTSVNFTPYFTGS